jgi:hypothetical protein
MSDKAPRASLEALVVGSGPLPRPRGRVRERASLARSEARPSAIRAPRLARSALSLALSRRRERGPDLVALAAVSVVLLATSPAFARRGVRPLFEPTDLELEKTGTMDIDVQTGVIRSQGPARVVIPDFELDFGILRNLELDIDGAYAIEGPATGPFSFDHAAPDSLWVGAKIGVFDWTDDDSKSSWALGLQIGPKLPTASGSHGVGGEALVLIGHAFYKTHLVLNAGAFADPFPDPTSKRPIGLELGLDLDQDLDNSGRFSLTGELSGVRFVSGDAPQLLATTGLQFSATENLDLSLVVLVGFLEGSDRYGALIGVSPKIRFFH